MRIILFIIVSFSLFYSCREISRVSEIPSKSYPAILADINNTQSGWSDEYSSGNTSIKKEVIEKARAFLMTQLTKEIFPSWYGTYWDFNGTTTKPKEGHIACGYFVTTTLQDAGFDIPRVKWAQAASEQMILSATSEVKRFSGKKMEEVAKWLLAQEDALYIVGLDNHTGFVLKQGVQLKFIHSSPVNNNGGVASENATGNNPLSVSGYRVFGKLLNDEMVIRWLTGYKWKMT
jgi:hypothetical protein